MSPAQRPRFPHRLALLAALIVGGASGAAAAAAPAVRVEVLAETPSVRVTVDGPCEVRTGSDHAFLKTVPELRWQLVQPSPRGLQIGTLTVGAQQVHLVPSKRSWIRLNGTRSRGALTILRRDATHVQVVNEMPLEDYLKGVVPREVDARWPMETLKAQAIIARTFTLQQIADRAGQPFDVTMIWPQLYGGLLDERPRATEAVDATRGLVVTSGHQLVLTYYHTVCGGRTEDVEAVWPSVHSPSLRSVECPYCRGAPRFRWTLTVSDDELTQALARHDVAAGVVTDVQLGPRNRSGRVTTVAIVGADGSQTVPAGPLRAALGPNRLRSTSFTVRREQGRWIFEGTGWGHGVGLCQWGAARLGQRKQTAQQILEFYYPGAEIVSWPTR